MHELSVTEHILRVALQAADDRRILAIDLVVGSLSSFVDDSVQFYFEFMSRDTPAAGAELRFRRVSAQATCLACQVVTPVDPPLPFACPACGSAQLRVSGGTEFYLASIEVEES